VKQVHAEIDIDAPAERVWELLTDFESFPSWNPFIRRASGELRAGSRLTVYLQLLGRRPMVFKPMVTKVERNRELSWLARFIMPGLFDVERTFLLRPHEDGVRGVRFVQHEDCSGVLTPIIFGLGAKDRILRGYRALNQALKARAETPARGGGPSET
jgi:hypothetical protein